MNGDILVKKKVAEMDFNFKISVPRRAIGGAIAALALVVAPLAGALADTATYYLDQSNVESVLPDGTNYLKLIIDSTVAGTANFDVTPVYVFTQGANFGLQAFGFNYSGSNSITTGNFQGLAAGWTVDLPPPSGMDGFGKFDFIVQNTGSDRLSPLSFTITGLGGATSADTLGYFAKLSSNTAGQGNQYFAAHLAGFTTSDVNVTGGYFAGSTLAPVPEPETYAMMLAGLTLVGGIAGRRKMQIS